MDNQGAYLHHLRNLLTGSRSQIPGTIMTSAGLALVLLAAALSMLQLISLCLTRYHAVSVGIDGAAFSRSPVRDLFQFAVAFALLIGGIIGFGYVRSIDSGSAPIWLYGSLACCAVGILFISLFLRQLRRPGSSYDTDEGVPPASAIDQLALAVVLISLWICLVAPGPVIFAPATTREEITSAIFGFSWRVLAIAIVVGVSTMAQGEALPTEKRTGETSRNQMSFEATLVVLAFVSFLYADELRSRPIGAAPKGFFSETMQVAGWDGYLAFTMLTVLIAALLVVFLLPAQYRRHFTTVAWPVGIVVAPSVITSVAMLDDWPHSLALLIGLTGAAFVGAVGGGYIGTVMALYFAWLSRQTKWRQRFVAFVQIACGAALLLLLSNRLSTDLQHMFVIAFHSAAWVVTIRLLVPSRSD